jgi:hypothetical protein
MTATPTQVFLSYARADDETFVSQLHRDLTDNNVSVWWDRKAMESRGRSFLQELRDAIEAADRVIAVMGPHALASPYVRAEWEHALLYCRGVLPVLRIGEGELIPDELRRLHYVDFRVQRPYSNALNELIDKLAEPVPLLGLFRTIVPSLPPHFLPRREELARLGEAVLADVQRPVVVTSARQTTALLGMGGAGKSVLAAAFARAIDTRRAFSDGIVWLIIGREPDLFQNFRLLGASFNDDLGRYVDRDTAQARLPQLLSNKVCLIVLDDVWEMNHAASFRDALGPRCRLLVTTRDSGLVDGLEATAHPLDVLSHNSALQLLADWAGEEIGSLPKEAISVAEECGYLPLALAMTGGMIRGKPGRWGNVLNKLRNADLEKIQRQFPNYPYPNLLRAVEVSVASLEPQIRRRYIDLAIFPENSPVPEKILNTLWEGEGLDVYATQDLLDLLVDRSLAKRDVHGHITLHDLQFDYIRKQAGDLPALHRHFLQTYQPRIENGHWYALADDGYILDHLVWHLEKAGLTDDVHKLLASEELQGQCAWWEARDRRGQVVGFLSDLSRAWGLADADLTHASHIGARSGAVGLQMRYALIRSSLASLVGNVPAELLEAALSHNLIDLQQALAFARFNADPLNRVAAMACLLPRVSETQRVELKAEAMTTARQIEWHTRRLKAFALLAPHFSESERDDLYREVLAKAQGEAKPVRENLDDLIGADTLAALASRLPPASFADALTVARNISRVSHHRADAVRSLAPHVPSSLCEELVTLAKGIRVESDRAAALIACVRHLPVAYEIKREALTSALKYLSVSWESVEQLTELAPYLPQELLNEALAEVCKVQGTNYRAAGLAAIAPALSKELLTQAVEAARDIDDGADRTLAIAGLTQYLDEKIRTQLLRDTASEAVKHPIVRVEALTSVIVIADLAPFLPSEQIQNALSAVRQIHDPYERAHALLALHPIVPQLNRGGVLWEAIGAVRAIDVDSFRARFLCMVADQCPPDQALELWREALHTTLELDSYSDREATMEILFRQLPEGLLEEAVHALTGANAAKSRFQALAHLSSRLGKSLLREALRVARNIGDVLERSRALIALLPFLNQAVRPHAAQDVLALMREIPDSKARAEMFADIAPHIPPEEQGQLWQNALYALDEIPQARDRGQTIAFLASRLPDQFLGHLLAKAHQIDEPATRVSTLKELAERLPEQERPQVFQEALEAVKNITGDSGRSQALNEIAPLLPDALLDEALAMARQTGGYGSREKEAALLALIPRLSEPERSEVVVEAYTDASVAEMPYHLDTYQTFSWFCDLAPCLSEKLLEDTLATARAIRENDLRARALYRLAPHVPQALQRELYREAVTTAMAMVAADHRSILLSEFAQHLTDSQINTVVAEVRNMSNASERAKALGNLAPHVPQVQSSNILRLALSSLPEIRNEKDRADILKKLVPHLPEPLLYDAFNLAIGAPNPFAYTGVIEQVVLRLPKAESSREAFLAACKVVSNSFRGSEKLKAVALLFAESDDVTAIWTAIIHDLAIGPRNQVLGQLAPLVPIISDVGGCEVIRSLFESVRTVGRWWP